MKRARHRGMRGVWAVFAWAALLMFAVQPLSAQAMARAADAQAIVTEICSAHGGGKVLIDAKTGAPVQKQAECDRCPNCLAAPMALAAATPEVARTAFAYQPVVFHPGRDLSVAAPRAPPRPPSQGPPVL
jgi:hypothetical protein